MIADKFVISVGCVIVALSSCNTKVNSRKFQKSQIVYKYGSLDSYALSPDGSLVAILRAGENSTNGVDDLVANELEVLEVKSSTTLATVPLATTVIRGRPTWSVATGVRYCDHGKYILANSVESTFYILDAQSYKVTSKISFELEDHRPGSSVKRGTTVVLAGACAVNANVAAFELLFGPYGTGVTKIFNLDTGKQTAEIAENISPGSLMNLDVSPSGTSVSILVERVGDDGASAKKPDLVILNIAARAVSRRIVTDLDGLQAAFVGDSFVAVAGQRPKDPVIKLFDIYSGAFSQSFGDPVDGARASVGASADGKVILGYTGSESEIDGELQIHSARFTLWDRQTGRIIARSPEIPVSKISTRPLDLDLSSLKRYVRPQLELSQSGNTVLAVTLFAHAPDVYTLK